MKPSRAKAMKTKCYDCCGQYKDGRKDCGVTHCALYYWMPYRKQEPNMEWVDSLPKRKVGSLTAEQKRKMAERLRVPKNNSSSELVG